jgi:16S rRNA (adenine(1408)-N(1))-methyltransferase
VVVDIGTGSGSAVLRRAAREPDTLFVALDADARAMADASRRAARPTRRGGRDNVIYLVTAAEALPGDLCGIADEVTVILPWGSLLSAVLDPGSATLAGIAQVLRRNGELTMLVSTQPRDRIATGIELDERAARELARCYKEAGFETLELRPAGRSDVEQLSSGWGRRLGIPERRPAWLFRLRLR